MTSAPGTRPFRSRTGFWTWPVLLLAAVLACTDPTSTADEHDPDYPSLAGLIVSDAGEASGAGPSGAVGSEVACVARPPGMLDFARSATIRNLSTSGPTVAVDLIGGSFDPVAVAASAGDELELTFSLVGGGSFVVHTRVPPRRIPFLVRASPPSGRTDVFSIRPTFVFSEPLDASTVNSASVLLLANGTPVNGAVGIRFEQPWLVEFVPAAPLIPRTTYEFIATEAVRDLQGDALETRLSVTFTTAPDPSAPIATAGIAFVSDRDGSDYIYVADADGSNIRRLARGHHPAWSRDGTRVAFDVLGPNAPQIHVIDRDGSNERVVGPGLHPAWSPDGAWIVVSDTDLNGDGGINLLRSDGSHCCTRLIDGSVLPRDSDGLSFAAAQPVWSPDGSTIGFLALPGFDSYDPVGLYVMNNDGSGPRLLQSGGNWTQDPTWTPDGSSITTVIVTYGRRRAALIGTPTATHKSMQTHYELAGPWNYLESPSWSSDGAYLVFNSNNSDERSRIFVVAIGTTTPRQLIPVASDPLNPSYRDWDAALAPVNAAAPARNEKSAGGRE